MCMSGAVLTGRGSAEAGNYVNDARLHVRPRARLWKERKTEGQEGQDKTEENDREGERERGRGNDRD